MTKLKCSRFYWESPAWLRHISWKTWVACIGGAILSSALARAELPVGVPKATIAELADMRRGDIYWAAFRLLDLAIPLLILCTGFGARLRRKCESISGHRWFWNVTLFASAYLILAALIAVPFDFYAGYVQPHAAGHSDQTFLNWLKGDSVPLAARMILASLFIWLPYVLIAKSPRRWWLYCALAMAMMFAGEVQRGKIAPDWDSFFLISQAHHPSNAQRIELANAYMPWEQGRPLVYGNVCKSQ
jgi:hypothetical protein